MTDLMVDLETWGTRPGCAIRSVGAVLFDRLSGDQGPRFYRNIDTWSCLDVNLKIDKRTREWWSQQAEDARAALMADRIDLATAVDQFNHWLMKEAPDPAALTVWSHGASFDLPIWEAAAAAVGRGSPWKYWNHRDTRTLFELAGYDFKNAARAGTHHNAVDDAAHQARCVAEAVKSLTSRSLPQPEGA